MNISKLTQNLSKFRLVSFDVTDTLLKFKGSPSEQYEKAASIFGYKVDQNQLNSIFKTEFKKMNIKYPNYGKRYDKIVDFNEWWRHLVINTFEGCKNNIPKQDLIKISDKLISLYATEECWEEIDGAKELVRKIKADGKIIGIISNQDPRVHEVVKCMNMPEFDFIYTSYELDIAKPDKRIFDKVLQLYGVKPKEALHIGNTLSCDYLGAVNAGWNAILITNNSNDWEIYNKNNANNIKVNKNHVFNSIRSFLDYLEKYDVSW